MKIPGSIPVQDEAGLMVCWMNLASVRFAGVQEPRQFSPTEPMLLGTPGPGLPHGLVGVALTVREAVTPCGSGSRPGQQSTSTARFLPTRYSVSTLVHVPTWS